MKKVAFKKVAFIGLGIMGKPMAKNLIKHGYSLTVCDINADATDALAQCGADVAATPAEAAARCDVIVTMLPNSPQVEQVVLGQNGVLEADVDGKILVDMSSISPLSSVMLADKLAQKGCVMIDAPVSGGEPKAVDGSLAIMAGGDQQAFDKVKPMLLCMGASAVLIGGVGSGNVAKLANQIIVALNIAAVSEAMTFVKKAGADAEKVFDAIKGGLAGSTVLNAKMPMMLAHDYAPGFRMELHIKDLLNALATAQQNNAAIPLTRQVLDVMNVLNGKGMGKNDHSAVVRFYEMLDDIQL